MNKTFIASLGLVCMAFLVIANAQQFQIDTTVDNSKLIGIKWYVPFIADHIPQTLQACVRALITPYKNNKLIFQVGFFHPGLNGELVTINDNMKEISAGNFMISNPTASGNLLVLDHDCDYEWFVAVDTLTGPIAVFTKSPSNLEAINRGVELAVQYGYDSHHLNLQTTKCDYQEIFTTWKEERMSVTGYN